MRCSLNRTAAVISGIVSICITCYYITGVIDVNVPTITHASQTNQFDLYTHDSNFTRVDHRKTAFPTWGTALGGSMRGGERVFPLCWMRGLCNFMKKQMRSKTSFSAWIRNYTSNYTSRYPQWNNRTRIDVTLDTSHATIRANKELPQSPLPLLPNFKNPCWLQSVPPGEEGLRASILAGEDEQRWRLYCLPYFYLAGFPKCGTTDLFNKITMHPEITRTKHKELRWWGRKEFDIREKKVPYRPFSWYLEQYQLPSACIMRYIESVPNETQWHPVITGDGTPSTMWYNGNWPKSPENRGLTEPSVLTLHRIKKTTPEAKFIIILRNPTDRLYSDYLYKGRFPSSPKKFDRRVQAQMAAMRRCLRHYPVRNCLYDRNEEVDPKALMRRFGIGLYYWFLKDAFQVFPREQFLVLRNEDYRAHPVETLKSIFNFLELTPLPEPILDDITNLPLKNTAKHKKGPMLDSTRELLDRFHAPYNRNLSELLNDERFLWKDSMPFSDTDSA